MLFLDGGATGNTNKESIADFVSGIAGTNITASGGQLSASGGIASLAADTTPQVGGSAGLDLQAQLLVGNGGTTGIAISANGEVTMAAQPSCVVPADAVINITGDGTIYPVVWGTANEDRNGDFDDSTTFTCPVDGLYRFTANPGSSAYTSSHVDSRLTVVGANFAAEVQVNGFNCKNNGTTLLSIPFTALIDCDADDTVTFTFQVGGGA
jgi:hypothetical protein